KHPGGVECRRRRHGSSWFVTCDPPLPETVRPDAVQSGTKKDTSDPLDDLHEPRERLAARQLLVAIGPLVMRLEAEGALEAVLHQRAQKPKVVDLPLADRLPLAAAGRTVSSSVTQVNVPNPLLVEAVVAIRE